MQKVYLIPPDISHERAAREFADEIMLADGDGIHGSSELNTCACYAQWLENIRSAAAGNPPPHLSSAETYFAVREPDGEIVGIINLRHTLSSEFMRNIGGHIGYTVRPRERGKGVGAQMLMLALARCRELKIERVLYTCEPENTASRRVIERCGGIFESEIPFPGTDERVRRYWVDLRR